MQRILHFTRQLGSKASSSTSLLNPQSKRYLTPAPRRVRGLTASPPLLIDDNTKLGDQDDSVS